MASKGSSRSATQVRTAREPEAGTGGVIDLGRCGARRVELRSDRSAIELKAMRSASVVLDADRRVVLRRGGAAIATVTTEVAELRRCLEDGVRFGADLTSITSRGGLAVRVQPLASR